MVGVLFTHEIRQGKKRIIVITEECSGQRMKVKRWKKFGGKSVQLVGNCCKLLLFSRAFWAIKKCECVIAYFNDSNQLAAIQRDASLTFFFFVRSQQITMKRSWERLQGFFQV